MIILASFPNSVDIMPLVNQLWKHKITNRVENSQSSENFLDIIIYRTEDKDKAQMILQEFMQNLEQGKSMPKSYSFGKSIAEFITASFTKTPISMALIFIILLVFVVVKLNASLALGLFGFADSSLELNFFNTQIELMLSWQIWRYFTPVFIHGDIYALIFASFWFFIVAVQIEKVIRTKLIWLFLLSAFFINLVNFSFFGSFYPAGFFPVFHALLTFTFMQNFIYKKYIYALPNALFAIVMVFMLLGLTDIPFLFGDKNFNLLNLVGTIAGGFLASINFAQVQKTED